MDNFIFEQHFSLWQRDFNGEYSVMDSQIAFRKFSGCTLVSDKFVFLNCNCARKTGEKTNFAICAHYGMACICIHLFSFHFKHIRIYFFTKFYQGAGQCKKILSECKSIPSKCLIFFFIFGIHDIRDTASQL